MSDENRSGTLLAAPGTERPRRYLPKLRYELIGCGLHGHELLGTDAAALRPEDSLFARDSGGLRWYRCLRCDSWVALRPPEQYLTFLATIIFVPYEIYELTKSVSALKVVALVINLAIVAYLLIAKRLFGLRGGGKAERAEHDEDTGWAPIERATPVPLTQPGPKAPSSAHGATASRSNQ